MKILTWSTKVRWNPSVEEKRNPKHNYTRTRCTTLTVQFFLSSKQINIKSKFEDLNARSSKWKWFVIWTHFFNWRNISMQHNMISIKDIKHTTEKTLKKNKQKSPRQNNKWWRHLDLTNVLQNDASRNVCTNTVAVWSNQHR